MSSQKPFFLEISDAVTQFTLELFCFLCNKEIRIHTTETVAIMIKNNRMFQTVWGVLLVLAGVGVFIRTPVVLGRIEQISSFSSGTIFIRFCFYLIGILLIGGGSKKLYDLYQKTESDEQKP